MSDILMVSRSPNQLIFSFKQLSCPQTIFITCNGFFGFKRFVLVSGPLTKHPNIDFCATNVWLLTRFISPVTNSQYVLDPINKSILLLSQCPWLAKCKFCKNSYFPTANLYDCSFMSVHVFSTPNAVITFLSLVCNDLQQFHIHSISSLILLYSKMRWLPYQLYTKVLAWAH